jgi:hypothetical protein
LANLQKTRIRKKCYFTSFESKDARKQLTKKNSRVIRYNHAHMILIGTKKISGKELMPKEEQLHEELA